MSAEEKDAVAAAAGGQRSETATPDFLQMSGFQKTLTSDVDDSIALNFLKKCRELDGAYENFTDGELSDLAAILSVLHLKPGEQVLEKGAEATFCGIVLDGEFTAVISDTLKVPLGQGKIIGEMAYFEGGTRSADIVTKKDSILAVITYDELIALGHAVPDLQGKFVHLLSFVAIRKFRNMEENVYKKKIAALEASGATIDPKIAEQQSKTSAPSVKKGRKLKAGAASTKKELLYSSRLDAQQKKADQQLDREKQKRKMAQHMQRNQQYAMQRARRQLEETEDELQDTKSALAQATSENASLTKSVKSYKEKLRVLTEDYETKVSTIKALQTQLDQQHKVLSSAHEKERMKLEQELVQHKEKSIAMTAQLSQQKNAEVDNSIVRESKKDDFVAAKREYEDKVRETEQALVTAQRESARLTSELEAAQAEVAQKQSTIQVMQNQLDYVNEQAVQYEVARKQHAAERADWESDRQRINWNLVQSEKQHESAQKDIDHFGFLLKHVSIGCFVRNFKTKKVLTAMRESLAESTAALLMGLGDDRSRRQSHEEIQMELRRKKARWRRGRLAVRGGSNGVYKLAESVAEECNKLTTIIQDIPEQISHWRETADSFFKRSIELTKLKKEAESSKTKAMGKVKKLRQTLSSIQQQQDVRGAVPASGGGRDAASTSHAVSAAAAVGGGSPRGAPPQRSGEEEEEEDDDKPILLLHGRPNGAGASPVSSPVSSRVVGVLHGNGQAAGADAADDGGGGGTRLFPMVRTKGVAHNDPPMQRQPLSARAQKPRSPSRPRQGAAIHSARRHPSKHQRARAKVSRLHRTYLPAEK